MIKNISISKKPKYIIVTDFENETIHYKIDHLNTINKNCDVGVWNVKYKI